jgi:hypothetical protein
MVAAVHAVYIAFVVFGFIAILLGVRTRWRLVRNVYFRVVHLATILLVCTEALIGMIAMQQLDGADFQGRLLRVNDANRRMMAVR